MSKARDGRHPGWKAVDVEECSGGICATVMMRGEEQRIKVTWEELHEVMFDGACFCAGECECTVEPDGKCPNGWPSRALAVGVI